MDCVGIYAIRIYAKRLYANFFGSRYRGGLYSGYHIYGIIEAVDSLISVFAQLTAGAEKQRIPG